VFENRVLRGIFGCDGNEIIGGCRRLCNEELHNFYYLPNIFRMFELRRMRWVGHTAYVGKKRIAHRILVRKPEEKRLLGGPK
jgi:hypothetical protein